MDDDIASCVTCGRDISSDYIQCESCGGKMFKAVYVPPTMEVQKSGLAQIITIVLADGRGVDISPAGRVQIYTPDSKHGVEIDLPSPLVDGGTVQIEKLG